jgi:hypothetical protein
MQGPIRTDFSVFQDAAKEPNILGAVDSSGEIEHWRRETMTEKPSTARPGIVERIIKSPDPREPEKAQISIEGADHLYREIRVENTLVDGQGEEVRLKEGAKVDVVIEADPKDTEAKPSA